MKVKHFGAADTEVGLDGDPAERGEAGFEMGTEVVGAQHMERPGGQGDELVLNRRRKRRWNLTSQLHEVRFNWSEVVCYYSVTYAAVLDEQIDIDFRSGEILFDQHPGIRPEPGDPIRGQRGGIISQLWKPVPSDRSRVERIRSRRRGRASAPPGKSRQPVPWLQAHPNHRGRSK